jgi:MFS family permease
MQQIQQNMMRYTSISRTIDPTYPTNIAISVLTLIAGVVAGAITLLGGDPLGDAVLAGFYLGAAAFIPWALAREIDPDHDGSAFLAAFLGIAGAALAGVLDYPPDLFALAALLILARIVNRVVGPPARMTDGLLALALTGIVIWRGGWLFGAVAGAAFALDALLVQPNRRQWIFAALALMLAGAYFAGEDGSRPADVTFPLAVIPVTVAFIGTLIVTKARSDTDIDGYTLHTVRVQGAMGVALLMGFLYALWAGVPGVNALLPLWGSLAGVSIWRLGVTVLAARAVSGSNVSQRAA